jgi:DeoR/GlpR family transcriptional regulator of sugar metabolism
MKLTTEARQVVQDALEAKTKLNVLEVTRLIDVSEATARRLFGQLEKEGRVIRTLGGIQLNRPEGASYSFVKSASLHTREKRVIGNRAAKEVVSGDHLYLDSGTTVQAFARALARRIEQEQLEDVRVVSNSLILTDILTPFCKVVLIGGEVRPERRDTCGFIAEEVVKRLHVNKAFLGCDALHFQSGFMTTDERTARMNELIIANASQVLILMDSSKIDKTSFVSYGPLEIADVCIVDTGLTGELADKLAPLIGRLILAG